MRGLTELERAWLASPAGSDLTYMPDEVPDGLRAVGRTGYEIEHIDGEEWHRFRITELGRLALRVCPVNE